MLQTAIVTILFAVALFYLGRMIYKNFTAKSGCASGCGKCAVDFSKLEKEFQKKHA